MFWFVRTTTGRWWPVPEPASWCLENARQPLLEPARDRLLTLDAGSNSERIVNVVLRRCGLNLVEVRLPQRVVVHYWTDLADPRPLFKEQRLARPEVQVAHHRCKDNTIVIQPGDKFLYGETLWHDFSWEQYQRRWEHRDEETPEDWTGAVHSSYSWEGLPERWIPWAVLKCLWRREQAPLCPNCDLPLVPIDLGVTSRPLMDNLLIA